MKKPDWIKAIDEAIEAKQRIYAMNSQDRDRRKMDTVPMTAMRRMNEGAIDYWKQQAFTMAAGQCCVKSGGLMADDRGHQYCDMERQRDEWKRKAEEAARDSARLDWMIEHGTDEGGGSGFEFRVYIPHDSECLRDAIDAVLAAKGAA